MVILVDEHSDIAKAARLLIAKYGVNAKARADERIRELKREEQHAAAEMWREISATIAKIEDESA